MHPLLNQIISSHIWYKIYILIILREEGWPFETLLSSIKQGLFRTIGRSGSYEPSSICNPWLMSELFLREQIGFYMLVFLKFLRSSCMSGWSGNEKYSIEAMRNPQSVIKSTELSLYARRSQSISSLLKRLIVLVEIVWFIWTNYLNAWALCLDTHKRFAASINVIILRLREWVEHLYDNRAWECPYIQSCFLDIVVLRCAANWDFWENSERYSQQHAY